MDSNIDLFKRKKHELATFVDRWWTHEDLFTDFRVLLNELKQLAVQCPEAYELEVQEIEEYLRNECFIE